VSEKHPLNVIEDAARNCYQSKSGNTEEFIKKLLNRTPPHLTPFEMVDVRVELITDRGCMSEITRHRHASFNIESTRYVNYKRIVEFILPMEFYDDYDKYNGIPLLSDSKIIHMWGTAMERCEQAYKYLIMQGCSPQLARSVLPNSLKTKIIMKANLREWLHIFKLRTSSGAHPQMKALMKDLKEQFRTRIPVIFDV